MVNKMSNVLNIEQTSVLFVYENIIRCPDTYIIKKILDNPKYREKYKEYIDIEFISTLTSEALLPYIIGRDKRNILEYFAIKEFDYDRNYMYLHEKFDDLYMKSYPLKPVAIIDRLIKSYCIDKIYIYNDKYDKRQHYDVSMLYNNNDKVIYCSGNIQNIIDNISKLSVVYDWDSNRINKLTKDGLNSEIIFVLAAYGFNFVDEYNLVDNLSERDNVSYFQVFSLSEKNMYKG